MKALKVYFIMALVWVTVGSSLVACSDKGKKGAAACPSGQVMVNGYCNTNPSYPPSSFYSPNGYQENGSKFRDFIMLINYSTYRYYGPGQDRLQIKVSNIDGANSDIFFNSPQLQYGEAQFSRIFSLNKIVDNIRGEIVIEVYTNNPIYRKVGELVLPGRVTVGSDTAVNYEFIYFDNSNYPASIMYGVMYKGIDY